MKRRKRNYTRRYVFAMMQKQHLVEDTRWSKLEKNRLRINANDVVRKEVWKLFNDGFKYIED